MCTCVRASSTFSFVTIYHCIFWYMSLGYFYLLYHVECDVAFSSDGIRYRYDTLIQLSKLYHISRECIFIVLCIIHQLFKDCSCIYNMQSQGCRSLNILHLINKLLSFPSPNLVRCANFVHAIIIN